MAAKRRVQIKRQKERDAAKRLQSVRVFENFLTSAAQRKKEFLKKKVVPEKKKSSPNPKIQTFYALSQCHQRRSGEKSSKQDSPKAKKDSPTPKGNSCKPGADFRQISRKSKMCRKSVESRPYRHLKRKLHH